MKNRNTVWAAFAAILALSSCMQEENEVPSANNELVIGNIYCATERRTDTRATTADPAALDLFEKLHPEPIIWIGGYEAENDVTCPLSLYIYYENDREGYNWERVMMPVVIGSSPVSIFAYYNGEVPDDLNTYTFPGKEDGIIPLAAKVYNAAVDDLAPYLTTGDENTVSSVYYPFVNLTLKHAYALLTIRLANTTTSFGLPSIKWKDLRINTGSGSLLPNCHLDLKTGKNIVTEEDAAANALTDNSYVYSKADYSADELTLQLLIPQQAVNDWLDISLTTSGDSNGDPVFRNSYTIPKEKFTLNARDGKYYIARGYEYKITLDMANHEYYLNRHDKPVKIHSESSGSYGWYKNTYMAPGNLVANRRADGTYAYSFAAQGQWYSTLNPNSEYFCWNCPTPDKTSAKADDAPYDPADDPCTRMGKEWHTGTIEDWQWVDNSSYTTEDYKTYKNKTFKVGMVKNPIVTSYDLYFPFAGYRDPDDNTVKVQYEGDATKLRGYYWLAYYAGRPANEMCAFLSEASRIYFVGKDYSYGNTMEPQRNMGLSIRCFKTVEEQNP